MKKITKFILLGVFILSAKLLTVSCMAQDMHFSQFTMIPLNINPSQAGNFNEDIRVIANYRNQWSGVITYPYKSFGASFDMPFKRTNNNYFGCGMSVYSDKAGEIALGLTSFNLSIAYHQRLADKTYLSAGLQGGFIQSSLDRTQMRFDNQFDGIEHNENFNAAETFNSLSYFMPDFAAGILYSYVNTKSLQNNSEGEKINIGLSVNHITNPDYSFLEQNIDNLSFRYILHTYSSFGIKGTNIAIQPSGLVAYQHKALDLLFGSYFRYKTKEVSKNTAFSLGVHYRIGDAIIPAVFLEIKSFTIGMSYDVNISALTTVSAGQGGFEISLRYITPNPFMSKKSQARFF